MPDLRAQYPDDNSTATNAEGYIRQVVAKLWKNIFIPVDDER